jgi:hypothetical protein
VRSRPPHTPKASSYHFDAAKRAGVQALVFPPGMFLSIHRAKIIGLAANNRLSAIYSSTASVDSGGNKTVRESFHLIMSCN